MNQIAPYSIGVPQTQDAGSFRILYLDKPFVTVNGDGIDVLVAVRICTALNLMERTENRHKLQEELWAMEERLDRICTEPLEA